MYLQNFSLTRIKCCSNRLTIIIVICLFLFACSSGKSLLVTGVSQTSVNDILLVLGNNSIKATTDMHKDGTFTIMVDSEQKLKALTILSNNGLPKAKYTNLGEVFKKDGLISSPLEEHNRNIYALNQEISNMLSELNGVISVHTEIALPKPNDKLWQTEVPKPVASVLIKFKQGARVDLYTNKIKALVSHSVEGLTPDQVEVLTIQQQAF